LAVYSGARGARPDHSIRRHSCIAASCRLFDHFVSACEQRGRHGEAKSLGGFEVDHQLVFGALLDGRCDSNAPHSRVSSARLPLAHTMRAPRSMANSVGCLSDLDAVNVSIGAVRQYSPKIPETVLRSTDFPLPPGPYTNSKACSRMSPVNMYPQYCCKKAIRSLSSFVVSRKNLSHKGQSAVVEAHADQEGQHAICFSRRGARRWLAPRIREIVHTSRRRRRCHSFRINRR
jgi:hypothetical protein